MALMRFLSILLVVVGVVIGVTLGAAALSGGVSAKQSESCDLSNKLPQEVLRWCGHIQTYSEKFGVPPNLTAAVMWQESGGYSESISRSGAVGLMQIMPKDGIASGFECKNGPCFADRPSTEQLLDPEFNVKYGARMLGRLEKSRGGWREALKAYGPMDVGYSYADQVLIIYDGLGN